MQYRIYTPKGYRVWRGKLYKAVRCVQHRGHFNIYKYSAPTSIPTMGGWLRWQEWMNLTQEEIKEVRTLTIELRFDADEEDKHAVLKDAAMQAAKHLFTSALLITAAQ